MALPPRRSSFARTPCFNRLSALLEDVMRQRWDSWVCVGSGSSVHWFMGGGSLLWGGIFPFYIAAPCFGRWRKDRHRDPLETLPNPLQSRVVDDLQPYRWPSISLACFAPSLAPSRSPSRVRRPAPSPTYCPRSHRSIGAPWTHHEN